MAFYLVQAEPEEEKLDELAEKLKDNEFEALQPFGRALTFSLRNARRKDGLAIWEEEDYCSPPLADEREAVLEEYFTNISVQQVRETDGWNQINDLPALFPELSTIEHKGNIDPSDTVS